MWHFKKLGLAAVIGGALIAAPARADVWDTSSTDDDDTPTGDNVVVHGASQTHDLAADTAVADQDWYVVPTSAYSSHEFVMEGLTGDVSNGQTLERVNSSGTVLTAGANTPYNSLGNSLSVRWETGAANAVEYVRVAGAQCTTTCNSLDQYSIRYYETTASVARYNNAGSQITVLLLQNPTAYTISGTIRYWSTAGALVGSSSFSAPARALIVSQTAGVTGATSGSITIAHDGRYGDLQGKAVALEPATGFSFDTPMVYKPY